MQQRVGYRNLPFCFGVVFVVAPLKSEFNIPSVFAAKSKASTTIATSIVGILM